MTSPLDRVYFRQSAAAKKEDMMYMMTSNETRGWLSEIQSTFHKAYPGTCVEEVEDYILLGILYKNPNATTQTFSLSEESIDRMRSIYTTTNEPIEELFFFVSLNVTAMPFGAGIARSTGKTKYPFKYSSYLPLAQCAQSAINKYVAKEAENESSLGGGNICKVMLVLPDYTVALETTFLHSMLSKHNPERAVYMFSPQSSYSKLTAMVLMNFTFPDLENGGANIPLDNIYEELLKHQSESVVSQRQAFATRIKSLLSNRDKQGRLTSAEAEMWDVNVKEIVKELELLSSVTPALLSMNEALRRLIINPFTLRASRILKGVMLVETKLCENQAAPPSTHLGTGPVDITIGTGAAILNVPDPEDVPVCIEESGDPTEIEAVYAEIKIDLQAKGLYQGCGGGHDLMFVEDLPKLQNAAAALTLSKSKTGGQKRSLEAALSSTPTVPDSSLAVYKVPRTTLILSTGHTWRLYALSRPEAEGEKVAVRYGGELSMPVLHYLPGATTSDGKSMRTSGAAAPGEPVDEDKVIDVLSMLVWAGMKK